MIYKYKNKVNPMAQNSELTSDDIKTNNKKIIEQLKLDQFNPYF